MEAPGMQLEILQENFPMLWSLGDLSRFNILKRNGTSEKVDPSKLLKSLYRANEGLDLSEVNFDLLLYKVFNGICDGIKSEELVNLTAETCAQLQVTHPVYNTMTARVVISQLHKRTSNSFAETMYKLHTLIDKTGRHCGIISKEVWDIVKNNKEKIEAAIDYSRDFTFDFFGFKTLEKSYLLKNAHGKPLERPQDLFMRVALGFHKQDIDAAIQTYNLMSSKLFTHATPTLFYSGTVQPQMSSCFLLATKDDSVEGIFNTLDNCAQISKCAGGIGLAIHNIRAKGSYVAGVNGQSAGIVPILKMINNSCRYVDQGGGRRAGAYAIYLEPWHAQIFEFLDMRKNHGDESMRARDLFYALWVPDLFMKRVEHNEDWTLMCPHECPGLHQVVGEEFEKLYMKYEEEGRGRRVIKAQELFKKIVYSQIETGTPFMCYKDAANQKSNQQNLGTIKSSNLCTEIIEYTDADQVAVCNLASICLPKFVVLEKQEPWPEGEKQPWPPMKETFSYDHEKLHAVAKVIARNLNKVIDANFYPVPESKYSNFRNRPIGIGVQGLADTFQKMRLAYADKEALELTEDIFETIYHGAVQSSMELARDSGEPYPTIKGSPISQGKFQFDLWGKTPRSGRYDWESLREQVKIHGVKNSLLVAPMPTASTSQIMGNNESFDPCNSNIYTRRVMAGEFICINPHLVKDLQAMDLWTPQMTNLLIAQNGSVQNLPNIPPRMKQVYRTVWEIKGRRLIELAAARGPYICQSQSLNIYMAEPTYEKMSAMHFAGWKMGLKTGMYYLRSRPAVDAVKFSVDLQALIKVSKGTKMEVLKAMNQTSVIVKEGGKKVVKVKKNAQKRTAKEAGFSENSNPNDKKQQVEECPLKPPGNDEECLMCGS